MRRSTAGFTLVEAIVAMTLSSVLVVLVSTTFLVQNRYYALQLERSAAQDNARMVTEMVASEIRSTMAGGVTRAENKRLVVRTPIATATVCAQGTGGKVSAYFGQAITSMNTADMGGVALLNQTTGVWEFKDKTNAWTDVYQSGGTPSKSCATQGTDTLGVSTEFSDLRRLNTYFTTGTPANGSVLMFYRSTEYKFDTSGMNSSLTALYRGLEGQTLVEFATGMNSTAGFKYRTTGGTTYANSVTGSTNLAKIDAIRIDAQALRKPRTGGVADVTFGWGVNVFLRNGG